MTPPKEAREPLVLDLEVPPLAAASAVREAVELWDADLKELDARGFSARVVLPVAAGLRHGVVQATVTVEAGDKSSQGKSSRVLLTVDREAYRLQPAAVMILSFAALGALAATLWPFFPGSVVAALAPIGILLAFAGWFLVTSRLVTRNQRDFLDLVDQLAEDMEAGEPWRDPHDPGGLDPDALPEGDALAGLSRAPHEP